MAEVGRMSVQELVGKVLADEHADVLRQAVCWLAQELMEAEVSQARRRRLWGAQRRPGGAPQWLSGAGLGHPGRLDRAGHPQASLGVVPSQLPGAARRSEQALVAVVQEAYVNGVSTRKVDRLVEALGLAGISKDTVSRLCGGLDEQVTAFQERPLDGTYPYLWLDANLEKVRAGGRVEHHVLVVAYGVDASGQREVIGLDVGAAETEAFWREFLRLLVRRGLTGVQLVISDAHAPPQGRDRPGAGLCVAALICADFPAAGGSRPPPSPPGEDLGSVTLEVRRADPSLPVVAGLALASGSRAASTEMSV